MSNAGKRVGIIGAGTAGLQQARALLAQGLDVVVFDARDRAGGLWEGNYLSYGVQVPHQLFGFPDFPFKQQGALADLTTQDYIDGATAQAYIESYVRHYGLDEHLALGTRVTALDRRADGQPGWTFAVESKKKVWQEVFDYAVVATGMYSSPPNVPSLPGTTVFESGGGTVLHSSGFTSPGLARGKRTVVIGGGKSAVDIASYAATEGGASKVTMLFRRPHWGTPRLIGGLIPFQYVFLSRFGQLLVSLFKGGYPHGAPRWLAPAHFLLAGLMRGVFCLVEALFAWQLGHHKEFRPDDDVVKDFYGGAQVLSPEFNALRAEGKVETRRGEVAHLVKGGLVLSDAGAGAVSDARGIAADLIVTATGFTKSYDYLPPEYRAALDVQEDGLYLYRHIFPAAVPQLAFCGSEVATISNLATHALHAEFIARVAAGKMALPTEKTMRAEIEQTKAWKRSWMPTTSCRSSLVLLHQVHYHDQLLEDMGLPAARKGANVLAEWFMPYQPRDYDGIIGSQS